VRLCKVPDAVATFRHACLSSFSWRSCGSRSDVAEAECSSCICFDQGHHQVITASANATHRTSDGCSVQVQTLPGTTERLSLIQALSLAAQHRVQRLNRCTGQLHLLIGIHRGHFTEPQPVAASQATYFWPRDCTPKHRQSL